MNLFRSVFALACVTWATGAVAQEAPSSAVLDLDSPLSWDRLTPQLASKRVVFVGETHDRYDHHLNQLEIIRRLYQVDPNLAIGVEYFQRSFQPQLDDYIAGRTTEQQLLESTDYYKNWGYDYRLYAPIFRYAREQHIPVRALNVPGSLPSAVAKVGMAGLTPEQRSAAPKDIQPADAAYRARLREAFEGHPSAKPDAFNHFVEAQLVWDESMAESAAEYLSANPNRRMVVLAGAGHIEFGSGIPSRLERRAHVPYAIVLSSGETIEPKIADYFLLSQRQQLPPAGTLGVMLEDKGGECRVGSVLPGSAAEKAGIQRGDAITAFNGKAVKSSADLKLALWDKKPGERVNLSVRHKRRARDLEIELGGAALGPAHP